MQGSNRNRGRVSHSAFFLSYFFSAVKSLSMVFHYIYFYYHLKIDLGPRTPCQVHQRAKGWVGIYGHRYKPCRRKLGNRGGKRISSLTSFISTFLPIFRPLHRVGVIKCCRGIRRRKKKGLDIDLLSRLVYYREIVRAFSRERNSRES